MNVKHYNLIFIFILIMFCTFHISIFSIAEEEDIYLQSSKYQIVEENGYISRIIPETTLEELKQNFNIEPELIHIYKDNSLAEEVTSGYISTGMYLAYDNSEEKYE